MRSGNRVRSWFVLVSFLLSGAAALIYEVAWTRALSLVLGSTTYAVSTMLATFMAGLAVGAWVGGKLADRGGRPLFHFGLCELGIGLTGLISLPLIHALPRLYLEVYRAFHLYPAVFFAVQILMCALVMAVPTTLMGATFPLVSRAITPRLDEMGARVGNAYSFNTAGAVAGSLAAGFVLIPTLGLRGAVLTAGLLNLLVGLGIVVRCRSVRAGLVVALVALYLPAVALAVSVRRTPSLFSFYSAHRFLGSMPGKVTLAATSGGFEQLFEGDYAEGPLSAFRTPEGHLLLQVGGKIEGTGPKDLNNTRLLAYLPLAAHPEPRKMLVIGLGAGVTLAAAREQVDQVDLAEIHPGVIEVVSNHGPPGVLDGVRIFRNDARNHLLRTDESYDVISSEPSYPTESVVGHLFTREFFEIAARRLGDGGVYCQWLPYHMLTNDDVTMMIKTFGSVFPHALLWKVPDGLDLILLGSRRPFDFTVDEIEMRVTRLNSSGKPLEYELSRTSEQIAQIARVEGVPINTDDHPILEFKAAWNLLLGDLALIEQREEARRLPTNSGPVAPPKPIPE